MNFLANTMRQAIDGLITPFDWLGPFWGLTLLSILSGIGMLWVVGKTTPQVLVERSRNRMDSAVYEIRLFLDSPKRVMISLGRLISHSILYIAFMLPAFVILALPLGMMYLSLETRHGLEPLAVNVPAVVTVDLAEGVDGSALRIEENADIAVTAPPLYLAAKQQVYVRILPKTVGDLTLSLVLGDVVVNKQIVTDSTVVQVAPDRASGGDLFFSYGPESGLTGPITGMSVVHDAKDSSYLGIPMPWWLWWLFWMMIAAFGLRKPMGVAL